MNLTAKDLFYIFWGISFSWFLSYLNGSLSLIITLITAVYLFRRKSLFIKCAIILSPLFILPAWNIGHGILDYNAGEAKIKFYGYPGPSAANINEEFRLEYKPMGCLVSSVGTMTSNLYNKTVKSLVQNFGYQKGSYNGLVLTKEEALKLLASDKSIFCEIEIIRDDNLVFLKDEAISEIDLSKQHGMFSQSIRKSEQEESPIIVFQDNFAVIRINEDWIYLIDTKHKKIVRYYKI